MEVVKKSGTGPTKNDKSLERQQFDQLNKLQAFTEKRSGWIDRLFGRWVRPSGNPDWVTDAEWAHIMQEPLRARRLLYGVAIAIIALIAWVSVAPLDEIARGDGRVIPSQQLQTIQSLDGGLVEDILVREGQVVERGDLLIKVDPVRFVASLGESRAQFLALSAEVARLSALTSGTEPLFPAVVVDEAAELLLHEQRLYRSSLDELNEQQSVYQNQIEQRQQELAEARAAENQYRSTLQLTVREIDLTRPLLASGAVSDIDILRLERQVATAEGELGRARATVARGEAAVNEAINRRREVELSMLNRWQNQLSESRSRLDALTQAGQGLADMVRQAEIRTPIRGTVQRMHVNTVGGVLTPGRDVVDIVPLDDQLMIEARIHPKDIAFIRPDQKAVIRFTAYDFAIYGGLGASVTHISADTITDERDNTFYLVRLMTDDTGFTEDLLIIPGMTTQVDIITGKRTVLSYLLKPILRASSQALTER